MTVKKDTITAMFKAGVNVGDDPKTVSQELLKCENGYFDRMGAISKRNGYTTIGGTVTEDILTKHGDNLVAIGGNALKVYNSDDDNMASLGSARAQFTDVDIDTLCNEKGNLFLYPTIEDSGSLTVIGYTSYKLNSSNALRYFPTVAVYHNSTGIRLYVKELETGESSTPTFVRLVTAASTVYAIYCKSSHYLAHHSVSLATGVIDSSSTDISAGADVIAVRSYDAVSLGDGNDSVLIAYPDTAGDLKVKIMRDGSVTHTATLAATSVYSVGLWRYSVSKGMILYYDGGTTTLRHIGYNSTLGVTVADHVVDNISWGANVKPLSMVGVREGDAPSGKVFVTVYDDNTGVKDTYIMRYAYTDSVPSTSYEKVISLGASVASRPFMVGTEATLVINYRSQAASGEVPAQSTYIVIDEGGHPRGKFLVNRSGPSSLVDQADEAVASNVITSGNEFTVGALVRTSMSLNPWQPTTGAAGTLYHDIGFAKVKMDVTAPQIECIEQNGLLLIPNSCPYCFDGQEVVEQGFLSYPEGLSATLDGTGHSLAVGTYGYRATYEWTDGQGNTHSSAASPAVSIAVTTTQQVLVNVPLLWTTLKTNVKVVLYRTEVNGDIYYRHMVLDNSLASLVSLKVQFTDDGTESVDGKALLYTTGNIADNVQPHPYWLHCIHQDRVMHVSDEYPATRVYYSKHILPGEGVPHTDVFYIEVAAEGGDITAIASYMGQFLIFKKNRIYASSGNGYTDDSQGTDYSTPFEIARDVGCTNHRSIAKTDRGVVFKTSREICLLNQTFRIERIGERARYYTDSNTIVAAVVHPEKGYVVFFTAGPAVVYSYIFDQWSTFTEHDATDAVEIDGTVYWHDYVADEIRKESTVFQDDGGSIVMTIETGWIALADLGGVFRVDRVWPVGQNISGHILNLQTAVDLIPYWDEAQPFDADTFGLPFSSEDHYTGLGDGYIDKEYIVEVRMRRPKCHAVRFRIFDSEAQSGEVKTNEGYSLTALVMRVGVRPGYLQVGSGREV